MRIRLIFLLFIVLFFSSFADAQFNYKKGFIINQNRDTIQGYIDLKEWINNPKFINFKDLLQSKNSQLGIKDIREFEVSGYENYKRETVKISAGTIDPSQASTGLDSTSKTDTVYLKVLIKGEQATLFEYTDATKKRYYLEDKGNTVPYELLRYVYLDANNPDRVVSQNDYSSQLTELVNKTGIEDSKLKKRAEYLKYTASDLSKFINDLNGLKGVVNVNDGQYALKQKKTNKTRLYIGASLNVSTFKYSDYTLFQNSKGSTSLFPQIDIGIEKYANPNVGRFVFRLELSLTLNKFNVSGYSDASGINNQPGFDQQKFQLLIGSLTPQVIYNFYNADRLKLFLGAGWSINAGKYLANTLSLMDGNTQNNAPELRNFWIAFPLRAGIILNKKLELYGSYTAPFSLGFSSKLSAYQVGLNYLLGNK